MSMIIIYCPDPLVIKPDKSQIMITFRPFRPKLKNGSFWERRRLFPSRHFLSSLRRSGTLNLKVFYLKWLKQNQRPHLFQRESAPTEFTK